MAGVIATGNHPKALWPGIKAWFGRSYNEHAKEYPDLFDSDSSSQNYEEDVGITGFGLAPVKPQGQGINYDSEIQEWTKKYVHVTYGLGYMVTREEQEDNLYEKVSRTRSKALAFSMNQTKENVAANIYNRSETSGYNGGDGVVLSSTSHPTRDGTQANRATTHADISEAAIEDMVVLIMNAKNSRGMRINLMAQSLHIAPANWFEANRILKSVLTYDTSDNAVNVLKMTNALPRGIKVNHYFTDTDAWYIRTNCPDGLKMYQRRALDFTQDNDFDTENAKAKSTERYSFGWTDWRGLYVSVGA